MRARLRKARKAMGLSVGDMATRLGISASFYYKIEQGARNPTLGLAKDISDIVGQSVDGLFFVAELDEVDNTGQATSLDATGA